MFITTSLSVDREIGLNEQRETASRSTVVGESEGEIKLLKSVIF